MEQLSPISGVFEFNGYKKVTAGVGSKARDHESPRASPASSERLSQLEK